MTDKKETESEINTDGIIDSPLNQTLDLISRHINSIRSIPEVLPGNKVEQEKLREILQSIRTVQLHTLELSEGKLHSSITIRGILGGALKNLQSNLKHLTWKTQMIAKGDFSQRVDFLHEFSEAFNSMVRDLDETKKSLLNKTQELIDLNESLYFNREQYKALIKESPVSICILNNGNISFTNSSFLNLIKAEKDTDIKDTSFDRLLCQGMFSEELKSGKLFSDEIKNPVKIEEELVCPDGSKITVEINAARIIFENEPSTLLFINDVTDKKNRELKILSSLEEKEILLKEVYHRVKNNLQIIVSLLSMQAARVKDKEIKKYFTESQNRVMSLALVHENLYRTDSLEKVNYGQYIRRVSSYLFKTYNLNEDKVKLEIITEEETISLKQAVYCSLIINELLSNSLKYAFNDSHGSIIIRFSQSEDLNNYTLDYRDTGPGIPRYNINGTNDGLGMKLINGIVKQLNGEMRFENESGVHYIINFPFV